VTPQSKAEVRALKRVRTSTSPYILYVTSLQMVYSNRSLFYGFAVACNPSTQPVLSAQLTEGFRNYTPNLSNHTKNGAQAAGFVAELRCKICPAACYFGQNGV
jgi:hypothetical protein